MGHRLAIENALPVGLALGVVRHVVPVPEYVPDLVVLVSDDHFLQGDEIGVEVGETGSHDRSPGGPVFAYTERVERRHAEADLGLSRTHAPTSSPTAARVRAV